MQLFCNYVAVIALFAICVAVIVLLANYKAVIVLFEICVAVIVLFNIY